MRRCVLMARGRGVRDNEAGGVSRLSRQDLLDFWATVRANPVVGKSRGYSRRPLPTDWPAASTADAPRAPIRRVDAVSLSQSRHISV